MTNDDRLPGLSGAETALARLHAGAWRLDGTREQATLDEVHQALGDVARLLPHLEGLQDALIRAHKQAGGSYGELAAAMGVVRASAQTRSMRVITRRPPRDEEAAASGPPASRVAAEDVRPGDMLVQGDDTDVLWTQVTEVSIWPAGTRRGAAVELSLGNGYGLACGRRELLTVIHRNNSELFTEGTEVLDGETLVVYRWRSAPAGVAVHWTVGFQGEGADEPETLYCQDTAAKHRQVLDAHQRGDDGAVSVMASTTPTGPRVPMTLRAHRIRWVDPITGSH